MNIDNKSRTKYSSEWLFNDQYIFIRTKSQMYKRNYQQELQEHLLKRKLSYDLQKNNHTYQRIYITFCML